MQALASNAVVAEVAEDVGEVRQAVVLGTEAQVALLVEPGCHGGTVGHQHPLPNVKLPAGPTRSAAQPGLHAKLAHQCSLSASSASPERVVHNYPCAKHKKEGKKDTPLLVPL